MITMAFNIYEVKALISALDVNEDELLELFAKNKEGVYVDDIDVFVENHLLLTKLQSVIDEPATQ